MDIESVLDVGGFVHNNPNYNPKSKKNIVSPYVIDTNPQGALNGTSAAADFLDEHSDFIHDLSSLGDFRKYGRYGITPSTVGNLDIELAEAQSNWSKAANSFAQTLVSEVGIGTLRGFSDLADWIGQTVGASDHNYSNPVSQYLENLQKTFEEEVAPIYSDPTRNTIADGGLGNFGWWASNFPSVASSLTLLLPSMAVTKGVSTIGKLARINSYTKKGMRALGKAAKARGFETLGTTLRNPFTYDKAAIFAENGLTATMSRAMENYQESRQTYSDTLNESSEVLNNLSPAEYNEFLNRNSWLQDESVNTKDRNEVAKAISRKAADRTFAMDWINVVFDLQQIYALRNIFTHAPKFHSSAAVRKAQRLAKKYIDKDAKSILVEEQKRSIFARGLENIGDYAFGFGAQTWAVANEGVEEAVNYIAQQEGLHLGKYLLTGEGRDNMSTNLIGSYINAGSRIADQYVKDPQLWDSAFWGVLGGLVFEGLGSKFNRLQRTIENRNKAKENAENTTTGEKVEKPAWWKLDNTSEVERMITEIQSRSQKFKEYQKVVSDIKTQLADGKIQPFEAEMNLEQAKNTYIDNLVIDARNNGTLDLLKEYLRSPELRKAFVDNQITSEQDANSFASDALDRAEKIDNLYTREITNLADTLGDIEDEKGNTIPAEYIQILASNNVRTRLNIERDDEILSRYENEIAEIEDSVSDRSDSNVPYRQLVKVRQVLQHLTDLQAKLRTINDTLKQRPSILLEIEKESTEKEIEAIKKDYLSNGTQLSLAEAIYADISSQIGTFDDKGNYSVSLNAIVEKYDDLFNGGIDKIAKELGYTEYTVEEVLGQLKKIQSDIASILPNKELDNISKPLRKNYEMVSALELDKVSQTSLLNITKDEALQAINNIHNTLNDARRQAIDSATKDILSVSDSNPDFDIITAIDSFRVGTNEDVFQGLNNEDSIKLRNALKVLNLADRLNRNLLADVIEAINLNKTVVSGRDESIHTDTTDETGELNNNNLNPLESSIDGETEDSSGDILETPTGQENDQNGQVTPDYDNITLDFNIDNDTITASSASSTDTNNISTTTNSDGTVTLNVNNESPANIRSNSSLFDGTEGGINNKVVAMQPVVRIDNATGQVTVVKKGVLQEKPSTGTTAGTTRTTTALASTPIPSTGGLEKPSTPQALAESRADALDQEYSIINIAIRNYIKSHANSNTPISYQNMKAELASTFDKISNKDKVLEVAKMLYESYTEKVRQKYPNLVDDTMEALASDITEAINNNKARRYGNNFIAALEKLVNDYINTIGRKKINGKYVISLENLLRYCNGNTEDNLNARLLFSAMQEYLTSPEASDSYIVVDKDNLLNDNFLRTVATSAKDIVIANNSEAIQHRMNVLDFAYSLDENSRKRYFELFDTLKPGDYIQVDRKRDNYRIYFTVNGTPIGYIGKPEIKNNKLYSHTDGWGVYIDRVGTSYTSPLADVFKNWAIPSTEDEIEINDILTELTYTTTTSERRRELLDKLENNKSWNDAVAEYGTTNNTEVLANGVSKLWKYITATTDLDKDSTNKLISLALDGWFDKLGHEYNDALALSENETITQVSISDINPGAVIPAITNWQGVKETDVPLASQAIAPNQKGKVAIGVVSKESGKQGTLSVSTAVPDIVPNYDFAVAASPGSSWVVLTPRSGKPLFVQARPLSIADAKSNSKITPIIQAVEDHITDLIHQVCIAKGTDKNTIFNTLDKFLKALYSKENGLYYSPFAGTTNLNGKAGNFALGIGTNTITGERLTGQDVNFFGNERKKNPTPAIQYYHDEHKDALSFTEENEKAITKIVLDRINAVSRISISNNGILADQGHEFSYSASDIIRRDKDNKFIIAIGDKTFSFNSFNEFIIDNDLVRINMKPDEETGENITRNPENTFAGNAYLKFTLETTSSPVEERGYKTPDTIVAKSFITKDQVLEILNNTSINQGEVLAKLVLDDKVVKTLVDNNLLPTTISYDPSVKGNAKYIISTQQISVGDNWLNMISDNREWTLRGKRTVKDTMRKQAIRKLIHEKLHNILHTDDNEKYIDKIKEVFDDFKKSLDNVKDENLKKILTAYTFASKPSAEALEEFLVESLTSAELANYLNSTTVEGEYIVGRKSNKESLLQKILRILRELLGIKNIKNNTLYAKEFLALANEIESTPAKAEQLEMQFDETNKKEGNEPKEKEQESSNIKGTSNDVATADDIEDEDEYESSITETIISSPAAYINSQPIANQAKIARFLERSEFSISCR